MPLLFRSMLAENGLPKVGSERNCLGVRPGVDVTPDAQGNVRPEQGKGMSVQPRIAAIPPRLVPRRLAHIRPGALGDDLLSVWTMGEGPFDEGPLALDLPDLVLRPDSNRHGTVGPAQVASLAAYQAALAATRELWQSVEN